MSSGNKIELSPEAKASGLFILYIEVDFDD